MPSSPGGPEQVSAPSGVDGELVDVASLPRRKTRKRGRPRCSKEPCGALMVWVPDTLQDRIDHLAKQRRQTVSEYLRDVLVQLFLRRP